MAMSDMPQLAVVSAGGFVS